MRDLERRIAELTDDEAMYAAVYLANWMGAQAKELGRLPSGEAIPDEQEALDILGQALPELADQLIEISAAEKRGQVARNILSFLTRDHASKVEEALNRPRVMEPFTASLGASILLLLLLEFDLEYTDKKSGKTLKISKKTSILEFLMALLGH